ncbi:MAG TPA: serine/threonine-protein kinase [Trebonia sp.]|nr:serine/threonine-protein kinase [Trebonia sp.]
MAALDSLPRKIGPYRLIDKIGEGGMGVVYLGMDPDRRRVAVKVLGPAVANDPNARQRLAREVETMRRVRNRHVAEVVDADVAGASPYVVTRYVPGRTLEETVREIGPLRGAALDRLAEGLAEALTAIHAAGVVHRDLKPGNVMLDDGQPVVIDFGIAHVPDATRLTQTGLVMGTPGYLAPEVIQGGAASGASDVHSWGTTVAYAATGRQPFGSGNYQTIFFRVLEGQADLDGMPRHLLPYVAAALSVDPQARPAARWLAGRLGMPPLNGVNGVNGASAVLPRMAATLMDYPPQPTRLDPAAAPAVPAPVIPAPVVPAAFPARAEYRSPAQAARDVADLLPPVAPPPAPGRRAPSAPQQALPQQPDWQPRGLGLLSLAAGVAAVGISVLLPVAGTALSLAVITLLRAVDRAQHSLDERRSLRGVRPSDIVIVIVTAPWTVVRAALTTVLLAPLAIIAAALAAAASVAFAKTTTLPGAGSWAAGAAVALYCVGPGSAAPRRQLRRMSSAVIKTRATLAVAFISCWALALAVVSSMLSQPPLIWPATSSTIPHMLPGLPSLGGTLHSVQGWLLKNTVGMLHLP